MALTNHKRVPREFKFILPIDPMRFIHGVREQWLWFLILPFALGVLGWILGSIQVQDRYSVSLQLIKSGMSTTIQTTEIGQAFRPRELTDDTLLSTTYSTEVLMRTAERVGPGRTANDVKAMIEIAKQRNTSLFYLTAHSRKSAQDAIEVVTAWADEIIRFTNNLQKEEAEQMEAFIAEQLRAIDLQLENVNKEILRFAREHSFVDAKSQTDASIAAYEQMRMSLADAMVAVQVKNAQINRYRNELREQNPAAVELKRKREQLAVLKGRYTDENPLVAEKNYEIQTIKEQMEEIDSSADADLKEFTGSSLGNNLYLEILQLESEREALQGRVDDLTKRLVEHESKMEELPEKSLRLTEMQSRRDLLVKAFALLDSRRKEAAFYQTKAPGYWRVFQRPTMNDVSYSSEDVKAMALGVVGIGAGLLLALIAAFTWELVQPGLRTPVEAGISTGTLPILLYTLEDPKNPSPAYKLAYKKPESGTNYRDLRGFWLTQSVGISGPGDRRSFLFAVTQVQETEPRFWLELLDIIQAENREVIFCNLDERSNQGFKAIQSHTTVKTYVDRLSALPSELGDAILIIRLNRTPTSLEVEKLRAVDACFLINSPSIAAREETRSTSELLRQLIGAPDGLLLLDSTSGKLLYRFIDFFEMTVLNNYFGKAGSNTHES